MPAIQRTPFHSPAASTSSLSDQDDTQPTSATQTDGTAADNDSPPPTPGEHDVFWLDAPDEPIDFDFVEALDHLKPPSPLAVAPEEVQLIWTDEIMNRIQDTARENKATRVSLFQQGKEQFNTPICGAMSDFWLARQRDGQPFFAAGDDAGLHPSVRAPLVQHAQNYYRKLVDNTQAARDQMAALPKVANAYYSGWQASLRFLKKENLNVNGQIDVRALETEHFLEVGSYRINMFSGPQAHAIALTHTLEDNKSVVRVFDPDSGEFTFDSVENAVSFINQAHEVTEEHYLGFEVVHFKPRPESPQGLSPLWSSSPDSSDSERVTHSAQLDTLAGKEVANRLKRYRDKIEDIGVKRLRGDDPASAPSIALEEVEVDQHRASVRYRDTRRNVLLPPVEIPASDSAFSVIQDFAQARSAEGRPLNALSKATLNALQNAPGTLELPQSAPILKARLQTLRLEDATRRLLNEQPRAGQWVPVLGSLKQQGSNYQLQLVNREQPEQTRLVTTTDRAFADFKRFVDPHLGAIRKVFTLGPAGMNVREDASLPDTLDGLNSAFIVQSLMNWMSQRQREELGSNTLPPDLTTTLKVHSYVNGAQLAVGAVQDGAQVVGLVQAGLRGEANAVTTSSAGLKSLAGKGGLLLSLSSVVLDGIELSKAPPEMCARFIAQLASDSANLSLSAASIAGTASGTAFGAAVAEFAGPVGVLLAGLGIGVNALVDTYSSIAGNAARFGRSIQDFNDNILAGGTHYDAEKKRLSPLPQMVIDELDLKNRQVRFGSPQIHPSKHGATGSGKINYFFWAGDMPQSILQPDHTIDIRQRLGLPDSAPLPADAAQATTVVLPGMPRSVIDSYRYNTLPFATARHDAGFDLLRKMEGDDFDFDFYIFPSERIIDQVHTRYQPTTVKVTLGSESRRLQMQDLPSIAQGLLNYDLQADSGEYVVGLMPGATVSLTSGDASQTEWILDARSLSNDSVTFYESGISVGGVSIRLADKTTVGQVRVIGSSGQQLLDLHAGTTRQTEIDASKYPPAALSAHLRELANKHQLAGRYLVVDNYTTPDGIKVGRALYEVDKDRYLYFKEVAKFQNTQLALQNGDDLFFYNHNRSKLFKVNANTGEIAETFYTRDSNKLRVLQDGANVMMEIEGGYKQPEATYRITPQGLELKHLRIDKGLRQQLEKQPGGLSAAIRAEFLDNPRRQIHADSEINSARLPDTGLVTVDFIENDALKQRYWWNMSDGTKIKTTSTVATTPNAPLNPLRI